MLSPGVYASDFTTSDRQNRDLVEQGVKAAMDALDSYYERLEAINERREEDIQVSMKWCYPPMS